MKSEIIEALISYRMERSRESIRAAEIMLENEMFAISMNRVYYSMFYAVQALLVLYKVSFSKHGQVKGYFNRELIKTGIFQWTWGNYTIKFLNTAKSSIMLTLLFRSVTWFLNTLKKPGNFMRKSVGISKLNSKYSKIRLGLW